MKTNCFQKHLGGVLILLLCAAFQLHAQPRPGGFGGFGGFNAFNRNNASSTTSGQYNNNGTVGTANIQYDPVTHNIIIAADAETTEQIRRVIASLDAPEPQVLIKAVFLEVQDNKALDLGVQGNYTGANGTFSQVTGFLTNSYSYQNVESTAPNGTHLYSNPAAQRYPRPTVF